VPQIIAHGRELCAVVSACVACACRIQCGLAPQLFRERGLIGFDQPGWRNSRRPRTLTPVVDSTFYFQSSTSTWKK
jgi:hypothetical protein